MNHSVTDALGALERRIGHTFKDRDLLRRALTHPSAATPEHPSYQRLEFLGDRVLGLAVAEMLLAAFPLASEGELSPRLADLVRKETCADVAKRLELGTSLIFGGGKAQRRTLQTRKVLGDACEAVIGAIFMDAGYDVARSFVTAHWSERMLSLRAARTDAKTALQEWAQAQGLPTPTYTISSKTGPDHALVFEVKVLVSGKEPSTGDGHSRREAEQEAAENLLVRERIWDDIR